MLRAFQGVSHVPQNVPLSLSYQKVQTANCSFGMTPSIYSQGSVKAADYKSIVSVIQKECLPGPTTTIFKDLF